MMKWVENILALIVVLSGVVIAQVHGFGFWVSAFNGSIVVGMAVSLTWEAASLLYWLRDRDVKGEKIAKWVSTSALVAAMVIQSIGPVMDTIDETGIGNKVLSIQGDRAKMGYSVRSKDLNRAIDLASAAKSSSATMIATAALTAVAVPLFYWLSIFTMVVKRRELFTPPVERLLKRRGRVSKQDTVIEILHELRGKWNGVKLSKIQEETGIAANDIVALQEYSKNPNLPIDAELVKRVRNKMKAADVPIQDKSV